MSFEIKPITYKDLDGISEKTISIHHDKLYAGYVNKRNEIAEKLKGLTEEELTAGNQIYSYLRGLKEGETFAANGDILHRCYFSHLGGDGDYGNSVVAKKLIEKYGSVEKFFIHFKANGMAARGWAILAYDSSDQKLRIFNADAQNHGGVWGAIPIIALDVYEHSYFIDYGSDRAGYIDVFMKNLDWKVIDENYAKAERLNS